MDGEKMENYKVIGKELSNDQAYGKVTGRVKYCSDMQSLDMLHMRLKAGTVPHGIIRRINTDEALALPGVVAVYSCENTPGTCYDRGRVEAWENVPNQEKLFDRHIRFLGERVAAVVAVTEETAAKACELITVEYENLPTAISVEEAAAPEALPLHAGGNVYEVPSFEYGNFEEAGGDICHESRSHIGRMTHLAMETQSCRAAYDAASQKLTIWSGCQSVFGVRSTVAEYLGMPYSRVRVIKAPMGGSFGVRQETLLEPLTAYAARMLEADVKLVYTREEQIVNTMMKHSLDGTVKSKIRKDGTIAGLSMSCTLDAGAYLTVSRGYASTIGEKIAKVYRMPNIHFDSRVVCTNTPINGSFRSWGSCEEALLLENHWNMVCREMGIDPVEFRLKNILYPYETEVVHKIPVGNVHFRECLLKGRETFGWEKRKEACRKRNREQRRYHYGVGMALASHTSSFYPYRVDVSSTAARIQEDGSLIIHVGIHDHGCGTVMAMKKIASEIMEISLDKIELNEADTQNSLYDYGCYASRTVYSLGQSVKQCCEHILEMARETAAAALGCSRSFLRYRSGEFFKEMDEAVRISLKEVIRYSIQTMGQDIYYANTTNAGENPGVAAAHFTEVRVDTYTGMTKIMDCLSVHDIGKAINPDLCKGQIGSGIQQGMGMALCEEIKIHPKTGQTLITNFKNYEVANACDLPDYQTLLIEEPENSGPFGAKSIGEVVVVPVAPAIVAGVNDALGTNLTRLPLTPAVILEALEERSV